MTTFIDIKKDNIVGIYVDGKIDAEEFDEVASRLESKIQKHSKVRLYIELESFEGFSLKALMYDLKFALSNWDKFEKEAIVTKKNWIPKVTDIGDDLVPDVKVKAFAFEEKEAAKQWIQE